MITPALFVSEIADIPDDQVLKPSDWNNVVGVLNTLFGTTGTSGAVLMRNAASLVGASWIETAAGVLISSGVDQVPVFRALIAGDLPQIAYGSLSGLPVLGNSSALDVGTGSGTVAAGDHLHTGVYEPAFVTLPATKGGTGFAAYTVGDMLFASSTTALSKLALGAAGTVLVGGAGTPAWSASPTLTDLTLTTLKLSNESFLISLGPNIIAMRNSTALQTLKIYESYTSDTNYMRLSIGMSGGFWNIDSESAGAGVLRSIKIGTWWAFSRATGSLLGQGVFGYTTGAGGTITQGTSKSTTVVLNTPSGRITMHNASLDAGVKVSFAVTNSLITATDSILVGISSGGTANAYRAAVTSIGAGTFTITVENITAGALAEAPIVNFAVMKGASS